ncbi:hypothetical protein ATK36_1776 [Amycolatopsis sulphurea]|uniref:Proline-rich protein n=1 Tax=Amycolatopsis sulphurea TaxID=76022 RepID=A0A2A9F8F5_9PSEU|nr:hypothetical protein [Amycolatopsis sulphurea]PFG46780.1 hypothetical protein ATK36_1776 [Amycolatopsis sulphurea]
MSTEKPTAMRVYLARVRTALGDLPEAEIEEVLEDVRTHLAEIEVELGASAQVEALVERLGTPESYAAELRVAGGYPPAPKDAEVATPVPEKAPAGLLAPRIALWGMALVTAGMALMAFSAAVRIDPDALLGLLLLAPVFVASLWALLRRGIQPVLELPEVTGLRNALRKWREGSGERAAGYLRSLKPAWWVICAVVLVLFGLLLMVRHTTAAALLPFLVVAAAAVVWAGPRAPEDRRLMWFVVPVSAFVVGGIVGGFGAAVSRISPNNGAYYSDATSYAASGADNYGNQQLRFGDEELRNVYAFDASGKPLEDVYLYDDQGRPLTITRYGCEQDTGTTMRRDADNRFPRPKIVEGVQDSRGNVNGYNSTRAYCREESGVPFVAAIPKPPASTPPHSGPETSSTPAPPTQPAPPMR